MFGAKQLSRTVIRNTVAALAPNVVLEFGGADRDRTGGLLVANQALSQLSYSPMIANFKVSRFKVSETFKTLPP